VRHTFKQSKPILSCASSSSIQESHASHHRDHHAAVQLSTCCTRSKHTLNWLEGLSIDLHEAWGLIQVTLWCFDITHCLVSSDECIFVWHALWATHRPFTFLTVWLNVYMLTLRSEFDPATVFQTLYKSLCLQALWMSYECQSFADFQCQCIKNQLSAMFIAMNHHFNSSAQLHQDNLRKQKMNWTQLKTNTTCLFCLQQKSEHVLMCGHAVCDTCVWIFRQALSASEYHYFIHTCMLCQSGFLTARLKSFTAEYQVLSVDGEGPWGIIPLKFMRLIQNLICECSVQDLFDDVWDISFGTAFNLK